jgi:hypothetical protein
VILSSLSSFFFSSSIPPLDVFSPFIWAVQQTQRECNSQIVGAPVLILGELNWTVRPLSSWRIASLICSSKSPGEQSQNVRMTEFLEFSHSQTTGVIPGHTHAPLGLIPVAVFISINTQFLVMNVSF